ncbi:MAG: peptide-methionine (S)-S-oxide reductase [Pedosphaera sp.]|nr:peptide-methionine (S)-S-oxide reductase [Pedosphaera sp.]MST00163.1 peptide-methionine (S)-S-oxide reductase [Pedosphaera sp.]
MNATSAEPKAGKTQFATFGGGCFWCVEAVFERFDGVRDVVSGYAAGKTQNPTYKQICEGTTGHAEVVQIEFDPAKISYEQLLEIFWESHDATTLNRQGADEGTQYRSIVICHDKTQQAIAEKSKQVATKKSRNPIVTEIIPVTKFWPAEEYHQDYFRRNPNAPYCALVISPKLQKLEKKPKR